MTPLPRALIGPVMAMARPARPATEMVAVRDAAALVRRETNLTSDPAIAREVAGRVVAALLADIEREDALAIAMAAIEQQLTRSPFITLATCADIDTIQMYVERRVACLRARSGRYLSTAQEGIEQSSIASEMCEVLTGRYLRHLRRGSGDPASPICQG